MRVLFAGLIACFTMLTETGPAQAATLNNVEVTYRYSFDVTDMELSFYYDGFSDEFYSSVPEVIDALHPLARVQGQRFSVKLSIKALMGEYDPSDPFDSFRNYGWATAVSCLAGPLCIPDTDRFEVFRLSSSDPGRFESGHRGGDKGFDAWASDYNVSLRFSDDGTGSFHLAGDLNDQFSGEIDGRENFAQLPMASFSIENVQAQISVPLPASSFLLGAGLIPLALLRRRRRG